MVTSNSPAPASAWAPSSSSVACVSGSYTCNVPPHLLPWFWALGLAAASISAVMSITGMLLQKVAYKRFEQEPLETRRKICGMPMNKMWWAGFFILVLFPLPFDFVALGLASASLVFPFGASVTVLVGQVIAPRFLKREVMRRKDWLATLAVVTGCCLTTAFGNHEEMSFESNQILDLYSEPIFLIVLAVLSIFFVASLLIRHHPRFSVKTHPTVQLAAVAYIPSYLGGVQTISFKSMSEVTTSAALGGQNEWGTWPPWFFMVTVIALATIQLRYMNDGGERFQATKFFPAYNVCLTTIVVVFGAVFFKEYGALNPVAFPIGLFLIGAGIVVLAGKDPSDHGTVEPDAEILEDDNGGGSDGHAQGTTGSKANKRGALFDIETGAARQETNGLVTDVVTAADSLSDKVQRVDAEASSTHLLDKTQPGPHPPPQPPPMPPPRD